MDRTETGTPSGTGISCGVVTRALDGIVDTAQATGDAYGLCRYPG
jgi:hypothetical protein